MKVITITSTLATILLVTACATPQASWRKTDINAEDTHTALADCKYQVQLNKILSAEQDSVISNCMESKGFRWQR